MYLHAVSLPPALWMKAIARRFGIYAVAERGRFLRQEVTWF
jgi:hypothetical protein